ncbi:MAG TPA: hypothetical protein VG271_12815 [Beijerinckiaceae bacterium]|nr:hypothetical protein [Beijerinckiaceae bacterium]
MDRINGFAVYAVGGTLFQLTGICDVLNNSVPYTRLVQGWTLAAQQLETLINSTIVDGHTIVELPLTVATARSMLQHMKTLIALEEVQRRANDILEPKEIVELRTGIQHFTSVLFAELPQADIYSISQKRAYKMSKFLAEAESVLPASALEFLSSRTRDDVRDAGRCVAFDQHTAAGFHAVRAVEAVARCYYEQIMDKPAKDTKDRPMKLYDLARELKDKADKLPKPLEHALGMISGDLDRIRAVYRNPIMHPEMTLTDDQAIRVFNITTDVIAAMIGDVQAGGAHFARAIVLPNLKAQF